MTNTMKKLFWKTYLATAQSVDGKLYSYQFFRGFTWEVVEMATAWVKEKKEKENIDMAVIELTRIK